MGMHLLNTVNLHTGNGIFIGRNVIVIIVIIKHFCLFVYVIILSLIFGSPDLKENVVLSLVFWDFLNV